MGCTEFQKIVKNQATKSGIALRTKNKKWSSTKPLELSPQDTVSESRNSSQKLGYPDSQKIAKTKMKRIKQPNVELNLNGENRPVKRVRKNEKLC